jgi:hypothetical protein
MDLLKNLLSYIKIIIRELTDIRAKHAVSVSVTVSACLLLLI